MKSWQYDRAGPFTDTLKLIKDASKPSENLKPDEILIQVASAGINPGEPKVAATKLLVKTSVTLPKTPGMDVSGHVRAVGSGVKDVQLGDAVIASLHPTGSQGALSEFVVVPRTRCAVLRQHPGVIVDMDKAAGLGVAGLTAYQSIAPYVKPGDQVFINGGSGGTGTFGIQVAKLLGCRVTVTCSTAKINICRSLGADEIIDYKQQDVLTKLRSDGQRFTVVMDTIGSSPSNLYTASPDFLLSGGTFVLVGLGFDMTSIMTALKGLAIPSFLGGGKRKFVYFMTKESREDLEQLASWMAEGKIDTIVDSVFEFEDALKAYHHIQKGSSAGKVIVRVAGK